MKNINLMLLAAIVALTFSGGAVQAATKAPKSPKNSVACARQSNATRYDLTNAPGEAKARSALTEAYKTATANSQK
ncbi:MAG: hypothetical protein JNM39_01435 [Bdellovibrionaceae bacterium]|nr:hypothetical protein [Pseudobdellovibrionaceae bacterium]